MKNTDFKKNPFDKKSMYEGYYRIGYKIDNKWRYKNLAPVTNRTNLLDLIQHVQTFIICSSGNLQEITIKFIEY